jgi:GDP-D-mannose dehydratase
MIMLKEKRHLDWKKHVKIDARYYRPTEVDLLIGDARKAASSISVGTRKCGLKSWWP